MSLIGVVTVVVGVIPTGVIIVTVVVVIVCLLIVVKKNKHRKNSPGETEDYAVAATALYSLLLLFSQLPLTTSIGNKL